MELKEAILKRRSIRKFKDKQINDDIIKELLISAMAAPSAMNRQPWEFYVVKNKNKLEEVKTNGVYSNYNGTLCIVVCGNLERTIKHELNDFWIHDCSAAIENILLSATSFGIGSVWCGLYPREERSIAIQKILDIPKHIIPLGLIVLGYPDEDKEERTQYSEEYVHII